MKTARELFEEIGYAYCFYEDDKLGRCEWFEKHVENKDTGKAYNEISFAIAPEVKGIIMFVNNEDDELISDKTIDMPTLKAISKQCEELGWLE